MLNLITSILQKGILHVTFNTKTFIPSVGVNSSLVVHARVSLESCGGIPCWVLSHPTQWVRGGKLLQFSAQYPGVTTMT